MDNNANRIEWLADQGNWLITESPGMAPRNLEDWAEEQPEMTGVSLVLAATNYACHWLTLPGVKGRHLVRALPFALEDMLVRDVSDYTVVPGGSRASQHKAYVVETDLIDRLLELLAIHHLRLVSLTPETTLLADDQIARADTGWAINIPGKFEGCVPDVALPAVLEAICGDTLDREVTLAVRSMDEGNLLKTTISSGYPDAFDDINIRVGEPKLVETTTTLLQGRNAAVHREKKPKAWWAGVASYAAVLTVLGCGYLMVDNGRKEQQILEVKQSSQALYKSWFPGESTSNYESKFRRKLRSSGDVSEDAGFDAVMGGVAAAWSSVASTDSVVQVQSIRYSERIGEFLLDVDAGQQAALQAFKQALEAQGLSAEIASAKADKDVIKGRIKVGGAA